MKSILRRRPSPALVISCIALFVSLGGVSYGVATGFIDSREIKNNSVRSADIRNSNVEGRDVASNTLKGADISEQDLGKVPSASVADTAGTATSAGTAGAAGSVGGVTLKTFNWQGQPDGSFVEVVNLGGLTVEASCEDDGGSPSLQVQAKSAVAHSEVSATWGGFGPAEDLAPGVPAQLADGPDDAPGTITYTGANGKVVTVQAMVRQDLDGVGSTTNDCGFSGIAYSGG